MTNLGIAYLCDGKVCVTNESGTKSKTFPSIGGGEATEGVSWSPTAQQLAYINEVNGTRAIWVVNADGSNPQQWSPQVDVVFGVPTPNSGMAPVWSPNAIDSPVIAYICPHVNPTTWKTSLDICISTGPVAAPMPCTNQTCPDGCCSNGQCFRGASSTWACGSGGVQCAFCTLPSTCDKTTYTCSIASTGLNCGPASCPTGCCTSEGKCVVGGVGGCGSSGLACDICSENEVCAGTPPACQLKPGGGGCSSITCNAPDHCCKEDRCVKGTLDSTCGSYGMECSTCVGTQACASGACVAQQSRDCFASCTGCCLDGECTKVSVNRCGHSGWACEDCTQSPGMSCKQLVYGQYGCQL
jgi:hypothetical protein